MDTQSPLQNLIENPVESLAVELKRWIDPGSPEGREKIAKGCLALYNNNGGSMVIGICDDGPPDTDNVPDDVRSMFHVDVVLAIVSKYSYIIGVVAHLENRSFDLVLGIARFPLRNMHGAPRCGSDVNSDGLTSDNVRSNFKERSRSEHLLQPD